MRADCILLAWAASCCGLQAAAEHCVSALAGILLVQQHRALFTLAALRAPACAATAPAA